MSTMATADHPFFVVLEPTLGFVQTGRTPIDRGWNWEHETTLAPGTHLRYLKAGAYSDACSAIFMDWDEFDVLDGPSAGQVVLIEDAGTLHDEHGSSHHWGPRPRLGPPSSVVPDQPLPPDWRWIIVP
jgi:hypothetical protein